MASARLGGLLKALSIEGRSEGRVAGQSPERGVGRSACWREVSSQGSHLDDTWCVSRLCFLGGGEPVWTRRSEVASEYLAQIGSGRLHTQVLPGAAPAGFRWRLIRVTPPIHKTPPPSLVRWHGEGPRNYSDRVCNTVFFGALLAGASQIDPKATATRPQSGPARHHIDPDRPQINPCSAQIAPQCDHSSTLKPDRPQIDPCSSQIAPQYTGVVLLTA